VFSRKLLAKLNLVLVLVFSLGMFLMAHYARNFLMDDARQQVLQQAQLMAASASATKDYTDQEVSPVLAQTPQHNTIFLSETIPFYAANATFKRMPASYPEYVLREAALNPTNLDDRPRPGLGGRPDWLLPQQPGADPACGREGHADGPHALRGRADCGVGRMPSLLRRNRPGAQSDAAALRARSRFRLALRMRLWRANCVGAHVGGDRQAGQRVSQSADQPRDNSPIHDSADGHGGVADRHPAAAACIAKCQCHQQE
jgi:hypothetical protein